MRDEDWAELLEQVGDRSFVGRDDEREAFERFLQDDARRLLHVCGSAGIGKTALLEQFGRMARADGWRVEFVDAEQLELTTTSVEKGLESILQADPDTPTVGLIDGFGKLAKLHPWMRRELFPQLPSSVRLVSAARRPLSDQWLTAPGWNQLLVCVQLGPLSDQESARLLAARQVNPERQQELLEFARGYPLALVVAADTTLRRDDEPFDPETGGRDLELLLRRLLDEAPSREHRQALKLSSLVRRTTEPLLASVLDVDDASDLLRWLARRPFFEGDGHGFHPHELIRRLVNEELRLYEESRRAELIRRTMAYYFEASDEWTGRDYEELMIDISYMLRDELLSDWAPIAAQRFHLAQPTEEQQQACLEMVRRFEGDTSAALAARWQDEQPEGLVVVRDEADELAGFCHFLEIDRIDRADGAADPAVQITRDYLDEAPLREGESARICRYWMGEHSYQQWSGVQTRMFLHISRKVALSPGVAVGLTVHAHPERWLDRPDNQLRTFGRFEIDDIEYAVLGRDWRKIQRMDWLRGMIGAMTGRPEHSPDPTPTVLTREAFFAAAKRAHKHFHRGDRLGENPLVFTPLVLNRCESPADPDQRVETLRALIEQTCRSLGDTGGDRLHVEILESTYLQCDAPTQQEIADDLDMAYSTYRYHLARATERVVEQLWALERQITDV